MAIWEETQTKGSLQMGFLEEKNLGFCSKTFFCSSFFITFMDISKANSLFLKKKNDIDLGLADPPPFPLVDEHLFHSPQRT